MNGYSFRYHIKPGHKRPGRIGQDSAAKHEINTAVEAVSHIPAWRDKLAELMFISKEQLFRITRHHLVNHQVRQEFIDKSKQLLNGNKNRHTV